MKANKKKRGIRPLNRSLSTAFSAILLILGGGLAVGLLVATRPHSQVLPPAVIGSPSLTSPPPSTFTPTIPHWKRYTNRAVGYSIEVPPQWKVVVNEDKSILQHQDIAASMSMNANSPEQIDSYHFLANPSVGLHLLREDTQSC